MDFVSGSNETRLSGTWEADAMQGHNHYLSRLTIGGSTGTVAVNNSTTTNSAVDSLKSTVHMTSTPIVGLLATEITDDTVNGTPRIANETRPKSIAMLYCVKAFDAPVNQGLIDITALANTVAGKVSLADFVGANHSLAAPSGYQKLVGGLVLQWCTTTTISSMAVDASTTLSVTFPVSFQVACVSGWANTIGGNGATFANVTGESVTGASVNFRNASPGASSTGVSARCYALGY